MTWVKEVGKVRIGKWKRRRALEQCSGEKNRKNVT